MMVKQVILDMKKILLLINFKKSPFWNTAAGFRAYCYSPESWPRLDDTSLN